MLNRLRHRRWMWAFALFAISFKLVAGTICLGDPVAGQHAGTLATQLQAPDASVVTAKGVTDGGACLLGEAACHCSCAETLPIPTMAIANVAAAVPEFVAPHVVFAFVPIPLESQLRPPIA